MTAAADGRPARAADIDPVRARVRRVRDRVLDAGADGRLSVRTCMSCKGYLDDADTLLAIATSDIEYGDGARARRRLVAAGELIGEVRAALDNAPPAARPRRRRPGAAPPPQ